MQRRTSWRWPGVLRHRMVIAFLPDFHPRSGTLAVDVQLAGPHKRGELRYVMRHGSLSRQGSG